MTDPKLATDTVAEQRSDPQTREGEKLTVRPYRDIHRMAADAGSKGGTQVQYHEDLEVRSCEKTKKKVLARRRCTYTLKNKWLGGTSYHFFTYLVHLTLESHILRTVLCWLNFLPLHESCSTLIKPAAVGLLLGQSKFVVNTIMFFTLRTSLIPPSGRADGGILLGLSESVNGGCVLCLISTA